MAHDDLKRADILKDSLIRQMMRADGVSLGENDETASGRGAVAPTSWKG